jgi:hypothetical protein
MIRGTFFLQQTTPDSDQSWGWTESVACTSADLTTALADMVALGEKRSNLLGQQTIIAYARVVTTGKPRDSLIYSNVSASQRAQWGQFKGSTALGANSDIPNTAILFRAAASPSIFRQYQLRGQPDYLVDNGGEYKPDAAFSNAVNRWIAQMIIGKYGIPVNAVGNLAIPVVTLAQNTSTAVVTITVGADPGWQIGDRIKFGNGKGAIGFHGMRSVLTRDLTGTTFTFVFTNLLKPYIGGMTGTKQSGFTVATFNELTLMYSTHRNTGRPSFSARGRRRRVVG